MDPERIDSALTTSLREVTFESNERNSSRELVEVRSVTNSHGLVRTSDFFENTRTSADTKDYKIVRPGMFVYNPARANVGSIGWLNEAAPVIVSPMYVVFGVSDRITPEYLNLYLRSAAGRRQIEGKTQVGARFRLTYASMSEIRLPVPSIRAQREVTARLATFEALKTELESELSARRIQYVHYRDSLLSFRGANGVRWVPMGEEGTFIRGRRFTKEDIVDSGIPSIHYGEIYTSYGVATESTVSHVRDDLAGRLRYALPGDLVLAAVGETVEDVGKAVAWLGTQPAAVHDDTYIFRHNLHPKYVSYWLQTAAFHRQKNRFVARAKVKRLSGENLAKVVMPVPDFAQQKHIVEILDRFDALVSDLSVGLPAELAARQKQYEYYRDRLLTFEEVIA